MKAKKSDDDSVFIPYDDENLSHVLAGPDYGQPESGSKEKAWSELYSKEYPQFVSEICEKLLKNYPLKITGLA